MASVDFKLTHYPKVLKFAVVAIIVRRYVE